MGAEQRRQRSAVTLRAYAGRRTLQPRRSKGERLERAGGRLERPLAETRRDVARKRPGLGVVARREEGVQGRKHRLALEELDVDLPTARSEM
jgi:hypothetical protein